MKLIISSEKLPIKIWTDEIEESALEQAKNLANLPFAFKHIALMPDCHTGYGMPIGGVLATRSNIIIVNAVGIDIGCGMLAVKTNLIDLSIEELKKIMGNIRKVIPVGFKHHDKPLSDSIMPNLDSFDIQPGMVCWNEYQRAGSQIGTLGSGNHFIEIQKGSDGYIWYMIHSGSRNLGKQVADFYNKKAIEFNEKWYSSVPKEIQLAFLSTQELWGSLYQMEMNYCIAFALANRSQMSDMVQLCFEAVTGNREKLVKFEEPINISHNYAALEHHFGQNVMVHRKGATLARENTVGIIPGSQGSKSYIVKGKGNSDSFNSCSHGAGRKMSRTKARNELDLAFEQKLLDDQGIIHSVRNISDLDEAPSSYKDIDKVIEDQSDLVEVLIELRPLGVIKG